MSRRLFSCVVVACGLSVAAGCAGPATESETPAEFPPEKTEADFPGLTYPEHRESLPPPDAPVWLIGIDGATWDLIRPMADAGTLPNFAAMMADGAHGVLLSEEPTISPALWATVATGRPRFEHGVVNFLVKLPGSYQSVESGPLDRLSPAVWELVDAAGGRSAVLGWFGSFPAEPIDGVYVSKGFDPRDPQPGQVQPPEFGLRLAREEPVEVEPGDLRRIAKNESFGRSLAADVQQLATLGVVANEVQPDLLVAYFSGIDVVQHVAWRHMNPASQQFPQDGSPDPELADVIPAYYRFIDRALGRIRELAPDDATLIVISDHGAGPMQPDQAFHLQLEVLLQALGLMREGHGEAFAISELYRHDKRIWLNLAGVEADGIVPMDQAGRVTEVIRARLSRLHTDDNQPLFTSIVTHTQDPTWQPGDAVMTVRFSPAALFTSEVVDGSRRLDFSPVRLRHKDVSGSHRLEGVVLLQGPGIRPGPLSRPANLYQIAPTILYRMGLPQDARMLRQAPADGGVIDAAVLDDVPVHMVAAYPGTDRGHLVRRRSTDNLEIDPTLEDNLEKLRSLGYIQ